MVRIAVCARLAATLLASSALRVGALRAGMSDGTLHQELLPNGIWQAGYDRRWKMCYWGPRGGDFETSASNVLYECAGRLLTDAHLNKPIHDKLLEKNSTLNLSDANLLIKVGKVFFASSSETKVQTSIVEESGKPVYGFHYSVHASNNTLNRHYTLHLMHGDKKKRSWYKVRCDDKTTWKYTEGKATCEAQGVSQPEPVKKCLDDFQSTFGEFLEQSADNCMLPTTTTTATTTTTRPRSATSSRRRR